MQKNGWLEDAYGWNGANNTDYTAFTGMASADGGTPAATVAATTAPCTCSGSTQPNIIPNWVNGGNPDIPSMHDGDWGKPSSGFWEMNNQVQTAEDMLPKPAPASTPAPVATPAPAPAVKKKPTFWHWLLNGMKV
jgi:hypothetical protein